MRIVQIVESLERLVVNLAIEQRRRRDEREVYCVCRRGSLADMTLVGPRPERPGFVSALNKQVTNYNLRHTIRPGITGWAQIRCRYGSSVEDAKEKLRYDLFYVKNISPGLDLLIFFQTIKTILWRRGAQ
ncbi:MAG: sugar transferase [Candidatus Acidiferrales bacterium]